jgi:hypothetical protein
MAECVITPLERSALQSGVDQLRREGMQLIDKPAPQVHPVFAGILQGFTEIPLQVKRADYVSRLLKFDWRFEWCDDGARYRAARAELEALRELQVDVDPDAVLWNQAAAEHGLEHLITRAVKVLCIKPDGERITTYLRTHLDLVRIAQKFVARHGDSTHVSVEVMPSNVAREVV